MMTLLYVVQNVLLQLLYLCEVRNLPPQLSVCNLWRHFARSCSQNSLSSQKKFEGREVFMFGRESVAGRTEMNQIGTLRTLRSA